MPCGLAQKMPTSLAVPELHLWAGRQSGSKALCTHPLPPWHCSLAEPYPLRTFAQGGDLQREADDAHEVVQGHKGAQDGADPQGLALASLD